MPEKANETPSSAESSDSFADLKRDSMVFPMVTAAFPGMLLVPHLGHTE